MQLECVEKSAYNADMQDAYERGYENGYEAGIIHAMTEIKNVLEGGVNEATG